MYNYRPHITTQTSRALITAPTDTVLSLSDCKAALGITTSGQDAMISAALDAAICSLDPATGGWLGRALRPQTWEYRLWEFPYYCEEVRLPYPTLTSVTSIKYDDANGNEQTLVAGTDYQVLGVDGFSYGSVRPAYNKTWPSARCNPESVRIRYVCGYATISDDTPAIPDKMPAAITQAIAMMVKGIVSSASQNMFVTFDRVEGVGEKRYNVTKEALEAMTNIADNMLFNYRPISI